MLLTRVSHLGPGQMPPLATHKLNQTAIDLLTAWIASGIAPEFGDIQLGAPGEVSFGFDGLPNQTYQVEFSSDFVNWTALIGASTDADGHGQAKDPVTEGDTPRIYRLLLP
jgi:hypothetical protein